MAAASSTLRTRFLEGLRAADGNGITVPNEAEAVQAAVQIVESSDVPKLVAIDETPYLRKLPLVSELEKTGTACVSGIVAKNELATCGVGITTADFAIAETGTLVLAAAAGSSRAVSLLPPVHVAIVPVRLLVETMGQVLERILNDGGMPSCLTLVTGPSRTGDIEQVLTIGVHGPGALHVILVG